MQRIILIIHNVRSSHNVGSMLRTADGFALDKVYLTGYSPYPLAPGDQRLPHVAQKVHKQIQKTALGAEKSMSWSHHPEIRGLLHKLKREGFKVVALEQTHQAKPLPSFSAKADVALIVGNEVKGLEPEVLKFSDGQLQIPMLGAKESFNVAVAAAISLYHLRFIA